MNLTDLQNSFEQLFQGQALFVEPWNEALSNVCPSLDQIVRLRKPGRIEQPAAMSRNWFECGLQ